MVSYYSEEQMAGVRQAFEEMVLAWPDVEKRTMFGCPAYRANGTIFAALITSGLVLTRLNPTERERLNEAYAVRPFKANGRLMKRWDVVHISDSLDFDELEPFIKMSYQNAAAESD